MTILHRLRPAWISDIETAQGLSGMGMWLLLAGPSHAQGETFTASILFGLLDPEEGSIP